MSEQQKRPFKPDYFPIPFKELDPADLLKWADDLDNHIDLQESKSKYLEAKINKRKKRDWMCIVYLLIHKVAIAWCLIEIYN